MLINIKRPGQLRPLHVPGRDLEPRHKKRQLPHVCERLKKIPSPNFAIMVYNSCDQELDRKRGKQGRGFGGGSRRGGAEPKEGGGEAEEGGGGSIKCEKREGSGDVGLKGRDRENGGGRESERGGVL